MSPPPPTSTLFPYTTLFRSSTELLRPRQCAAARVARYYFGPVRDHAELAQYSSLNCAPGSTVELRYSFSLVGPVVWNAPRNTGVGAGSGCWIGRTSRKADRESGVFAGAAVPPRELDPYTKISTRLR